MFYYYNSTPSLIPLHKIILFMSESKLIGVRCYSMEGRDGVDWPIASQPNLQNVRVG